VLGEAHPGTIWLPAKEYELPTQNIETQP